MNIHELSNWLLEEVAENVDQIQWKQKIELLRALSKFIPELKGGFVERLHMKLVFRSGKTQWRIYLPEHKELKKILRNFSKGKWELRISIRNVIRLGLIPPEGGIISDGRGDWYGFRRKKENVRKSHVGRIHLQGSDE